VPQLLLPIFDAGRNSANLDSPPRLQRDIAVAQYEKAIQTGFKEVADALAGRATLASNCAHKPRNSLRSKPACSWWTCVSSTEHPAFDVLDAQRSLFVAQQAVVQVQLQQVQNLVSLYKVLGGGWTD
jgi:multidrug efflux system outer membrane protein